MLAQHIDDVAEAHCRAWQKAFRGILSDRLLDDLQPSDFAAGWKHHLHQSERTNLVYVNERETALGFISFGPPKAKRAPCRTEIYGIYVHPDHWRSKIGQQLMEAAVLRICSHPNFNGIILWVMAKNQRSRQFYEQFGYQKTKQSRLAIRNGESFMEVQYFYNEPTFSTV